MHQSGILAAAALYGIQKNIKKLKEDNAKALYFANFLSLDDRIKIDLSKIETNIVMFSFDKYSSDVSYFIHLAKSSGILLYKWDQNTIRAVTHKDVSEKEIETAANEILKLVSELYKNTVKAGLSVVRS